MNGDDILQILRRPRADAFVPPQARPDPRFGRFLPDGTPRLSPSQVNLLLTCPARWKRHYLDGDPDPAGIDAVLGTLLHAAMEHALRRLMTGELVGSREIQQATMEAVHAHLADPRTVASIRGPAGNAAEHAEATRFAIRTAWDWVLETGFEPTHVEHAMTHRLEVDGHRIGLAMVADAIGTFPDGSRAIIDWKFPKRNPQRYGTTIYARPGHVLATNLYDAAARSQGIHVDRLLVAHFGRGEVRPAIAETDATQHDRQRATHITQGAVRLVLHETLPENPVAAGALCSERYCAHWARCPAGAAQAAAIPLPGTK